MSTVLQPIAHNAQEVGGAARGAKANDTAIHSALLRDQVEERCRAIMRDAEDAALSIEQELEIQLVKLPKKVRLMSLAEFQDAHGGDLASAAVGGGSSCAAPVPGTAPRTSRRGRTGADSAVTPAVTASEVPKAAGRTTRKRGAAATGAPGAIDEEAQAAAVRPKRGRAPGAGLQTPAPSFSAQLPPPSAMVPGTASRVAMPGEVVYSERGSPVLVPATVVHGAGVGRSRLPPSQQQQAAAAVAAAVAPPVPSTGIMLTTCSRIARTAARTTGRAAQKHEPTVGKGRKKRTAAAKKAADQKAEEEAAAAAEAEGEQQEGHEMVPGLALTTEDGKQISLEQGLAQLPAELQAEATRQLESLKGLVDSLLVGAAGGAEPRAAAAAVAEGENAKEEPSDGDEESRPKQRRQPTRKRSAVEEPKEDTKKQEDPKKKGAKKEEEIKEEAAASSTAKTPGAASTGRGGRKSMAGVQKGKWVVLATDVEEEKFTQPVPGHPGSFYYVAKVLERDGASMKIHYYATDGPNRKWFEGISRTDGTRHVEERAVDHREIIAVFEGLTKCHKKIPVAVMTEVQARLKRAPVTPGH